MKQITNLMKVVSSCLSDDEAMMNNMERNEQDDKVFNDLNIFFIVSSPLLSI